MCYGSLDPKYAIRDIEARVKHLSFERDTAKRTAAWVQAGLLTLTTIRRIVQVLVAAAAIAVTGCVETSAPPEIPRNTPLPADLRRDIFDTAIALQILSRCLGNLAPNVAAIRSVRDRAEVEAKRRGLARPTTAETLAVMGGERAAQDLIIGYIQRRGILINQPSTWCTAGQRELAEKTGISRYLAVRP